MEFTKQKDKLKRILVMLLVFGIAFPQGFIGSPAHGATYSNKVTYAEKLYSYYTDGTHPENNMHVVFEGSLNDNPIFCGNHSKPSPVGENIGDSKILTMEEYNGKVLIDKILYYGYGGPKQWSGFKNSDYYSPYKGGTTEKKKLWMGVSVTSMCLTRAYGGDGYWYEASGLPEFWEYVNDAETPPNGFQAYIMRGNAQEQALFTYIYTPEAYLTLKKSVSDDIGKSIKDAKYGVYSDSGCSKRVGTLTTKEDGTTNKLTLEPGTYYVKETDAPDGWTLDAEVHKVMLTEDKTSTVESTETPETGKLTLKKTVTKDTGDSIKGAKYGVYSDSKRTKKVGTLTTDSDGTTNTLTLIPGTYYVEEIDAPNGWNLDTKVYEVDVKKKTTVTVKSTETPEEGFAKLKKGISKNAHLVEECPEQYTLAGAQYGIYKTRENAQKDYARVGSFATEKNGISNTITLKPATYYVREIVAPDGFALDPAIYELKVENGKTSTLEVADEPKFDPMSIVLRKVDKDDSITPLEGAEFIINYYKVLADDVTGLIPARTWIMKTDIDGEIRLAEEYKVSGDEFFIDEDGACVGLIGTYEIVESKPPIGYVTIETPIVTHVTSNDTINGTIYNAPEVPNDHTKIEVYKVDMVTQDTIPGTILSVIPLDENDNPKLGETFATLMTDEEGKISIEYIPAGKYIVRETRANFEMGYVTAEDILIEVKDTAEVQVFTMEDDHTKVEITKTDIVTGEPLIGAQLSIIPLDENGNPKLGETWATWITTEEPYYTEYIPAGDYILREISAPFDMGYVTAEDIKFTVEDTGDIQKVGMADDHTKVEITKTDLVTGEPVIGAELSIFGYDEKGEPKFEEPLYTWTTTEEPHYIEYLPLGDYILREILTPYDQGYIKAEDIEFTIEDTGEIQKVQMQDDFTKIEILKVDADTKEPLVGAKFELYNSDGNKVAEWISTEEAHRIDYLPIGTYTLREVKAPEGYAKVTSEMTLEVKETGEVQMFEVNNKVIPVTGYDNTLPGYINLAVLAAIAFCVCKGALKKCP